MPWEPKANYPEQLPLLLDLAASIPPPSSVPPPASTDVKVGDLEKPSLKKKRKARTPKTLRERFDAKWKLEDPARGCWVWQVGKNKAGYGLIQTGTHDAPRASLANRVAWELYRGPIPEGMCVLHSCDNPPCVNPAHLFIGDNTANMADMTNKKRNGWIVHPELVPRGSNHGMAKLDDDKVRNIRRLLTERIAVREIARRYSVDRKLIMEIRDGNIWKHVQ